MKQWWQNTKTRTSLEDEISKVGGQGYKLDLSPKNPLGATSHISKSVLINPSGLPYPKDINDRQRIRYAPNSKTQWQKKQTKALVYHEAAHIRYSNEKPCQPLLGWLWNALEDGRIEKLLGQTSWHIKRYFKFLGDAAWCQLETTSDLLAACLYWRWECEYPADSYKFIPSSLAAQKLWDEEIRPLVEQSWDADNSDMVTQFAEEILAKLSMESDAALPSWMPLLPWEGPDGNSDQNNLIDESEFAGCEDDPEPLLKNIVGLALELAKVLNTPSPRPFPYPHRSQGELNLDRALDGSQRPFDCRKVKGLPRSTAILLLVDQSGSMHGQAIAQAKTAAMLIDCAVSSNDHVALGIWGFGNQYEPYVHRPFSIGNDPKSQHRIAGMLAWTGGTLLYPVFQQAKQTLLERQEKYKLLILFTDAELNEEDAELVSKEVQQVRRSQIHLQPIFIGDDDDAKAANCQVFGHVTACSNLNELIPRLCSWLRALLSR